MSSDSPGPYIQVMGPGVVRFLGAEAFPFHVVVTTNGDGTFLASAYAAFTGRRSYSSRRGATADEARERGLECAEERAMRLAAAVRRGYVVEEGIYSGVEVERIPDSFLAWAQRKLEHDTPLYQAAVAERERRWSERRIAPFACAGSISFPTKGLRDASQWTPRLVPQAARRLS